MYNASPVSNCQRGIAKLFTSILQVPTTKSSIVLRIQTIVAQPFYILIDIIELHYQRDLHLVSFEINEKYMYENKHGT